MKYFMFAQAEPPPPFSETEQHRGEDRGQRQTGEEEAAHQESQSGRRCGPQTSAVEIQHSPWRKY